VFNTPITKGLILCFWLFSGAFKFRGACNAVFSLDNDQAAKGVVTHSRFALDSLVVNFFDLFF
jgi:hypothetical protein